MKNKAPLTRDAVFQEALKKARSIYDELWNGSRAIDVFHRVHISPSGEITESVDVSHSCDPDEYFKKAPHPLTLWEIDGRAEIFEPEEWLGNDYHALKADFAGERGISQDEDEWSDSDWAEFNKQCVDAYKSFDNFAYPDHRDLDKKRAEFEEWADQNLASPIK